MAAEVTILGIPVHSLTMEKALEQSLQYLADTEPHLIMTPNAEILYRAHRDAEFRELLLASDLRIADGSGVIWAARYHGTPLAARVTGIDLMMALLAIVSKRRVRVFFLGAHQDVVSAAKTQAEKRWPGLHVCGVQDGYFSDGDQETVRARILEAKPHILFVGMGVPRQEKWMVENKELLNIPLIMGVGGSFDVLSGKAARAPVWMQRVGLEWFFRLVREPRRLRRIMTLPLFMVAVVVDQYKTGRQVRDDE